MLELRHSPGWVSSRTPGSGNPPPGTQPGRPGPSTQTGRFRVLIVDDDPAFLASLSGVLADHVEVVECTSSAHALAQLTPETSVVCTDFSMPKMNGLALAQEISKRHPHVSCLLVTGTTEDFGGKYYVLRKPFDPQRLLGIVLQLARISDQKRAMPRSTPDKP